MIVDTEAVKATPWLLRLEPRSSACRSCDSVILWGATKTGKKCPVDPEPVDGQYVSHFATCPNADQHRRED